MKNRTCVLLASWALGSSACAMYASKYEEPTSGSSATVVFKTNALGLTEPFVFKDAAECSGLQAVGGLHRGQEMRVRVPADRELATQMRFNVILNNVETHCSVMVSFRPAKDGVYQVGFNLTPDRRACSVGVSRLDAGGNDSGERVGVNRRVKLDSVVFDVNSAHCKPL